ncbi:methylaspartate mutase subunit E [Chloroflexota bacterium]
MEAINKIIGDEEFFREREEVLNEWPTGKEVDLEEAVEYHKNRPLTKNYAMKLAEAKRNGTTLLSINSGRSTIEGHTELLRCNQEAGGDLLTTWIDALTRNHRYEEIEKHLNEAKSTGKQVINGFPCVYYGVKGTRQIMDAIDKPVCLYANAPDIRLIVEIGMAGGHAGINIGGPICTIWQYTRTLRPEITIRNYQYCYRLIGLYEERGVPILTGVVGVVSYLIPHSIPFATQIIEALIAAEQGAKHIRVGNAAQGNLAQDIAGLKIQPKLCKEYLTRFGHGDVEVYCVSRTAYGRWPTDEAQAFARICYAPLTAALCGNEQAEILSLDEGRAIPVKENSAASLRCARMMLNQLKDQNFDIYNSKLVQLEAEMLEKETRAILDKVIELGDGDIVVGAIRGFEAGVLDQPWSTSQYVRGDAMGVRDAQGAVRWFNPGNLPFDKDTIDFHKEKVAERAKALGRAVDYETVIADIGALSKGSLMPEPWWDKEEAVAADGPIINLNL